MGNASSQTADGVHFLRLEQLGLETKTFRVIAAIGNVVRDVPFSVTYGADALVDVIHLAILLSVYYDAADGAGTNALP